MFLGIMEHKKKLQLLHFKSYPNHAPSPRQDAPWERLQGWDIRQAIEFGVKMNREETIEKVVREDNKNRNRVRYTITYDPKLPHLPAILSKNWNVMVDSDRRLNKAFPAPPMASLKSGPNLQDNLVRA